MYIHSHKYMWDEEKNILLKKDRGVSFEDVIGAINTTGIFDNYDHPAPEVHPGQKIFVVKIDGYAHMIPYETRGDKLFLRTIIPSRVANKKYS